MFDLTPMLSGAGEIVAALVVGAAGILAERHLGLRRKQTQQFFDQSQLSEVMRRAVSYTVARFDDDGDGSITIGDPKRKRELAPRIAAYALDTAPELLQRVGATPDALQKRALAELESWLLEDEDDDERKTRRARRRARRADR